MKNKYINEFKVGETNYQIEKLGHRLKNRFELWMGVRKNKLEKAGIDSLAYAKVKMSKGDGYLLPVDAQNLHKLVEERAPIQERYITLRDKEDRSDKEEKEYLEVSQRLMENIQEEISINQNYDETVFSFTSDVLVKKDSGLVLAALLLRKEGEPVFEWSSDILDTVNNFLDQYEESDNPDMEGFKRALFYSEIMISNPTVDFDDEKVKELLDKTFNTFLPKKENSDSSKKSNDENEEMQQVSD
jgi:hypothetical protein